MASVLSRAYQRLLKPVIEVVKEGIEIALPDHPRELFEIKERFVNLIEYIKRSNKGEVAKPELQPVPPTPPQQAEPVAFPTSIDPAGRPWHITAGMVIAAVGGCAAVYRLEVAARGRRLLEPVGLKLLTHGPMDPAVAAKAATTAAAAAAQVGAFSPVLVGHTSLFLPQPNAAPPERPSISPLGFVMVIFLATLPTGPTNA